MKTPNEDIESLWCSKDVAKYIKCNVRHIQRLSKTKQIPCVDISISKKRKMYRYNPNIIKKMFPLNTERKNN